MKVLQTQDPLLCRRERERSPQLPAACADACHRAHTESLTLEQGESTGTSWRCVFTQPRCTHSHWTRGAAQSKVNIKTQRKNLQYFPFSLSVKSKYNKKMKHAVVSCYKSWRLNLSESYGLMILMILMYALWVRKLSGLMLLWLIVWSSESGSIFRATLLVGRVRLSLMSFKGATAAGPRVVTHCVCV